MNGKWFVGGLFIAAVFTFAFGLWFNSNPTTPDQRFSRRRVGLPAEMLGPQLILEKVADFNRISFVELAPEPSTNELVGSAVYNELDYGKDIHLEIRRFNSSIAESRSALKAIFAALPSTDKIYNSDSGLDYVYTSSTVGSQKRFEFLWINNQWLFRVWTDQTDAEALLRFANSYKY